MRVHFRINPRHRAGDEPHVGGHHRIVNPHFSIARNSRETRLRRGAQIGDVLQEQ